MSRTLLGLISVLFLAANLCAAVPGAPDDFFDASRPDAFASGQKEFVLGLEGGRYAINDGRLLDSKTKHALTNAQVEALLAAPKGGSTDGGDPGPVPGEAEGAAAAKERANAVLGKTNFDGSTARADSLDGPPATGTAALPPARLQALFLNQLVFTGTPKEKAAMSEAVENVLKTKTGRELVAQYVDEKGSAEIVMGNIPGSKIVVRDGRKVPSGSGGNTAVDRDPPLITLNRDYMDADTDYRRVSMAGTLAHELLGHAFATQRSRKAKLAPSVNYYYRGDEIGAELVGWLVETELSGKVADGDPDAFLADPDAYYRSLWSNQPYYVNILSPEEMKNPLPALKARRAELTRSRARTVVGRRQMAEWRPSVEHFVKVHGLARERFKPAVDELDLYEHWAVDQMRMLDEISKNLEERIKVWSSPEGKAELEQLKVGGDSAFLKRADQLLDERRAELLRLRERHASGTGPKPEIPLPSLVVVKPGDPNSPIDLGELAAMQAKDVKDNAGDPAHWKK